ncbi:zinc finger and BTB domain-containing protein 42 [Pipistrellus kuhlii]|uniref:Zinc finger and BTB domain containing 42 n=1 Tax=Pipistrellus kuhlii TaxID=59472 RepID=A0A7J7R1Q5_PIPKU|nr:zinc finger and BTB domain-containing protein 42 [Pipistrellus kuhlii]XP_045434805.1 zinc finger and BTB domain-containing protein 42 [Pipistrellus kuhlii]KAF6270094.1 hypothetical protein mPipKuh1_000548 [Pipistrellus kuhlii]
MEFPGHGGRLLGRLRQQRALGFLCDCTVQVGAARFPAHRAVLAACSAHFRLCLRDRPAGGRHVRLGGGVTAPAFARLLDFMYEGRLDLRGLPVEDVLAAARYLHMDDVVSACRGRLRGQARAPPPPGTPAPAAEPARSPPRPLPAGTPELRAAAPKPRPPGTALRAALPPGARGLPPWQAPGEPDRALDLSLKPGRRREPGRPAVLQAPPCGPRQRGAGPPVGGQQDSPASSGPAGVGPLSAPGLPQSPRVPAARRLAGGLEPLPAGLGLGGPGPEREAAGDAPGGRPGTCPLCGQPLPGAHALQRHLSAHFRERDARPAPGLAPTCALCGKAFSCAYTLRRHERTHSGEKPFACGQCGKRFQYAHNLRRHAVVHTREKPHACRTCARRFTQSGDLYRHVRKFHGGLP